MKVFIYLYCFMCVVYATNPSILSVKNFVKRNHLHAQSSPVFKRGLWDKIVDGTSSFFKDPVSFFRNIKKIHKRDFDLNSLQNIDLSKIDPNKAGELINQFINQSQGGQTNPTGNQQGNGPNPTGIQGNNGITSGNNPTGIQVNNKPSGSLDGGNPTGTQGNNSPFPSSGGRNLTGVSDGPGHNNTTGSTKTNPSFGTLTPSPSPTTSRLDPLNTSSSKSNSSSPSSSKNSTNSSNTFSTITPSNSSSGFHQLNNLPTSSLVFLVTIILLQ